MEILTGFVFSSLMALAAPTAAKAPPPPGVVLSRTIGSVDETVFTSREAALSALMERLTGSGKDPGSPPPPDSEAGRREQAALLLEEAISREATVFGVGLANDAEIEGLAARATRAIGGRADWRRLVFSPAEIRAAAVRKLNAKELIRIRSDALKGVVSDADAQAYFEKNRMKFGSLPFSTFKENIKTFLGQQRLEDKLRAWFEILRRKHKVREEGAA